MTASEAMQKLGHKERVSAPSLDLPVRLVDSMAADGRECEFGRARNCRHSENSAARLMTAFGDASGMELSAISGRAIWEVERRAKADCVRSNFADYKMAAPTTGH